MSPPKRLLRNIACAAGFSFTAVSPTFAASDALTPEQATAVRDLVRETLVNDPDLLKDALVALQKREREQDQDRAADALKTLAPVLDQPMGVPPLGNPRGDVTILEFSDYNCGYCKQVSANLRDILKTDKNVRLYVLELPILGEESIASARLALAARAQDKYEDLHFALMSHRGRMTADTLLGIAKDRGLDVERLKRDAEDTEIEEVITQSYAIAEALGVSGTPAFVIGDKVIGGAVPMASLRKMIADQRKAK